MPIGIKVVAYVYREIMRTGDIYVNDKKHPLKRQKSHIETSEKITYIINLTTQESLQHIPAELNIES